MADRSTEMETLQTTSGKPEVKENLSPCQHMFSWRAVVYLLLQFSFIGWYIPVATTTMALVCANSRRQDMLALAKLSGFSPNMSTSANNKNHTFLEAHGYRQVMEDINWDSATRGLVLSGPMILSSVCPIAFDAITRRVGSRFVLSATQTVNAALMFTSPTLARTSPYLLLVSQILLGFTSMANVPVVATLIPRWTPERHKLTATAIVYMGISVGAIITSLLNGFLCSLPFDNGWPWIYYGAGTILFIYGLLWGFLMTDSPETHPFISEREKTYIVSTRSKFLDDAHGKTGKTLSYCVFIRSVPVLAYILLHTLFIWSVHVTLVCVPLYLNSVQGFPAEKTGVLFALSCVIRALGTVFLTLVGNTLTNRKILSPAATRKACICIGLFLAAVGCLVASFFDRENRWIALLFVIFFLFCHAGASSHLGALPIDMAPRYAGTLVSIATSVSLLFSISAPLLVSAITPTGTYEEWRLVWYILTAVYLCQSVTFLVWGQAKLQPWAAGGQGGHSSIP